MKINRQIYEKKYPLRNQIVEAKKVQPKIDSQISKLAKTLKLVMHLWAK